MAHRAACCMPLVEPKGAMQAPQQAYTAPIHLAPTRRRAGTHAAQPAAHLVPARVGCQAGEEGHVALMAQHIRLAQIPAIRYHHVVAQRVHHHHHQAVVGRPAGAFRERTHQRRPVRQVYAREQEALDEDGETQHMQSRPHEQCAGSRFCRTCGALAADRHETAGGASPSRRHAVRSHHRRARCPGAMSMQSSTAANNITMYSPAPESVSALNPGPVRLGA